MKHYTLVAQRVGHRCEYYHAPEVIFNFSFEVEHIIPLAPEGVDAEHNWALACRSCNLYKYTHIKAVDPENNKQVRLFHPRKDRWEQHFTSDPSGNIIGTTAIGRSTVACLRMNSQSQVAAREQWIQLGLFP